jgi:hypothetical protein
MSKQLEAKIEEVERKRQELEETIRRVGDALATGLDRDGLVGLAMRTALDACNADGGWACPRDGAFRETTEGAIDDRLEGAMEEAEERTLIPAASPEARTRPVGAGWPRGSRGCPRARHRDRSQSHAFSLEEHELLDSWPGRRRCRSKTQACTRPSNAKR